MNLVDRLLYRMTLGVGIALWLICLAHTLFLFWLITCRNPATWLERGAPDCFWPYWWLGK